MHSYHIFYFPFKWEVKDEEFSDFSQAIDLSHIHPSESSPWITNYHPQGSEAELLYDEKNYYYKFVHPVLYDTGESETLIKHYERKELQADDNLCTYNIQVKKDKQIFNYHLKLDALNLNFYSTGVGMLSFYMQNNDYKDFNDILNINQYGRRVFPPFYNDIQYRNQIALQIEIEGLSGAWERYREDFSNYTPQMDWHPARFISNLTEDLQENLNIIPIIDDRMFVNCWYQNKEMASQFYYNEESLEQEQKKRRNETFSETEKDELQHKRAQQFIASSDWYKYSFIDAGDSPTCRNLKMRKAITESTTYLRWQENGSIYGTTRYSLVLLTDKDPFCEYVLSIHMKTIYSRMIELVLIQRASMLKFSEEVTKVSNLRGKDEVMVAHRIGSLYKEYIRFMNQIYFKEVTTQDQGIELYNLLLKQFESDKQVKDLDEEIGELHNYITLIIDNSRNIKASRLNIIVAIFATPTLLAALFGMSALKEGEVFLLSEYKWQIIIIAIATLLTILILKRKLWIR